jgi:hypothetical protein
MKNLTTVFSALLVTAFLASTGCAQTDPAAVPAKKAASQAPKTASVKKDAAPAPAKAAPAAKTNDTLVIIARITEIPGKFAPNDLYNYVYIMKYRVLNVVKGAYKGQEILIGHYNPLIPRSQIKDQMKKFVSGNAQKFEVGAKHSLTLITPIDKVWKEAIEDEYPDSESPKYFALRTDITQ